MKAVKKNYDEKASELEAEYILEHIMMRKNWPVDTRDILAAYLMSVRYNHPRVGLTPRPFPDTFKLRKVVPS